MVRLEEVEDEAFVEKPTSSKYDELLVDDDADYTDTDSEISDSSDIAVEPDESLYERITALKDIVPPQTRARFSSLASTVSSATSTTLNYGGKTLWVVATSVLLLALPQALAVQDELMMQEEERQRTLMQEGASGLMNAGQEQAPGQAKAAL